MISLFWEGQWIWLLFHTQIAHIESYRMA